MKTCDILLKLDDGTEVPAHAPVLARCMPGFFDMMDGCPLSNASARNVISVPFSDCSLREADCYLSAIYSFSAHEHIDVGSALAVARLSHKYGVEVCLSYHGMISGCLSSICTHICSFLGP